MMGWAELGLALVVFLLAHAVPVRPAPRRWLVQHFGERGFLVAYSAISIFILGWLIIAAGRAPYIELWTFEPWQLWVPTLIMPVAVLVSAHPIRCRSAGRKTISSIRLDPVSLALSGTPSRGRSQGGRSHISPRTAIWRTSSYSDCSQPPRSSA
jgi:hypothetical protein